MRAYRSGLHPAEDLVQEELAVVVRQRLGALQDGGEVRLHQLRDDLMDKHRWRMAFAYCDP